MSASQLLAALESVPIHFSSVAGSKQAAKQARATALLLLEAALAAHLSEAWDSLLERWVRCS